MSRPLFNYSYQELEALFVEKGKSVEILTQLRDELIHRSTNKAKKLLERVREQLKGRDGSSLSILPAPEIHIPVRDQLDANVDLDHDSYDDVIEETTSISSRALKRENEDIRIPDDLQLPPTFTQIRPPGTGGLPGPYEGEKSSDLSLGLSKGADIVDTYIAALGALITEIKNTGSGQKRYELENGARVDSPQGEALYAFSFIDEAELFEDAQVSVEIQGQKVDGLIVSIGAGKLLLTISGDLGPVIQRAVLLIDATALLEALKEKLEKSKGGEIALNRSFSDAVVGRTDAPQIPEAIPPHSLSNRLKAKQLQALHRVLCASVTRIWGPPGSGKTMTLAAIVRSALEANKRLLICSNTNKAVDQLLLRVCDELGPTHMAMKEGRVVRVGRIADDLLQEKYASYVSVDGIIARLSHELEQRKQVIQESISKVDAKTVKARQVFEWFAKLDATSSQIRDFSRQEEAKRKQLQKVEDDRNRLESKLNDLAREMEKRQRSRFGLFQRSIDEITRSIAEVKGAKEQRLNSLVGIRTSLEEISERLTTTQRDHDHLNTMLRAYDRNAVQNEIAEAEKLRGSLIKELREIETKIAELRASITREAKVIGATCTKTYLSSKEFGQFDLVLIDEVSMIFPPTIWFISGLSRERVVVCGDPRQLPPIVPTKQQAIFDVLGHDVLENHENDAETIQLSIQYRMNPAICDLISGPMYDGKLQTEAVAPQARNVSPPEPFNGTLTIIDTSDLWPFESVTAFRSRFNLMHALLARNLAWHLNRAGYINGGKKRLGICTPYAAQAKLIQKLLEGEGLNEQVTSGTVHRYQGDESQMMVLEIPESHGGAWNVGQFVQGVPPSHIGARLLNVAVSRAQSHLVVIANLTHLDKHLPSTSLLRSILYDMQVKGRVISGKTLLELRPIQNDLKGLLGNLKLDVQAESLGIFDEKNFDAAIREDFIKAKKGIVIFSGFVTPRRVAEYGELFHMKIAEGVKVRCVTRPPYLNGSIPPSAGKQALNALEAIGCVVDCRSRIHQKVVLIANEIVWHGSLNTLSHAHITEESMTRLVNTGLSQALAASMAKRHHSGERATSQVAQPENPRCERCGSRTVYADGRYGPYFYCENGQADTKCDWSISMMRVDRERFRNGLSREERDPKRDQQGRRTLQGVQEKKRKAPRRR